MAINSHRMNKTRRDARKKILSAVDLHLVRVEQFSPEKFILIVETKKQEIKSVKFTPPALGEHGFGEFKVEWKSPKYSYVM